MDVDRMIPASAVILQSPDLASAVLWGRGDPPEVRVELVSIIRPDAPGPAKRRDGVVGRLVGAVSEHERSLPGDGDLREIRVRDHHGWHLADVGRRRIADDSELEELADARVARVARERLGQRDGLLWHRAVLVLEQVHHPDALPDAVAGKVYDDVVALGDPLLVELG